ncbi:4'-phosphopantetheinyl transferase superfamily protein [Cryobacterium algoritolerans]|uniref:4'-phosphopantetheinyl transferase superfamily protein n=1 Tax=Cryobacterium algoritolerans TaxID=1259184 RepID=A0A4R8WQB0_9MICO|nr:4'-phosphopantetheinyl transferase superfamily protein [Cryobacterium algoritolerans]TFC12429.1 4'-phosphopantetheinyl transferase superfamily protein [Cryobacterium algoritolerans]
MTDERTPDVVVVLGPRGETDAADRAFLLAAAGWALGSVPGSLSLGRHCPTCGGADHGRPILGRAGGVAGSGNRLDVSLSRAGSSVAVALSFSGPVGIDIESVDAVVRAGFDDVAFNPVELAALAELSVVDAGRARTAIWTGKEAALKAIGVGLRADPRTLTVRLPRPGEDTDPALNAEPQNALPHLLLPHLLPCLLPCLLPRLAAFDAGPGLVGTIAVFTAAAPAVQVLPAGSIRGLPVPVTEVTDLPH